jgi:uncharacterized membrane protein YkoI
MLKDRFILLSASLCAALAIGCGVAFCAEKEEKGDGAESLDKAPAAVQEAVKKAAGENKIKKFSKEDEDGKTSYEAQFEVKGVDHSVKVSEAGAVLEEEMDVEAASLPEAVTKAVTEAHKDAKVKEAEMVKAGGETFYEIEVMDGKTERELKVTADGKVTAEKEEKEEKSEKKD